MRKAYGIDCILLSLSEIHRIVSQKQLPADGGTSDKPGEGGITINPTQGDNTGGGGGGKQKCCN